ncbi:MAG: DUF2460 domain-containing protein [Erythrobacter sp.]
MAFWLARERQEQESVYLQRFDPRFWTIDFPRPMMGSVTTTGPDGLRVDVEMHQRGELLGLIWDSVDTLDHPLLAYETNRDYSHTTLRFRWQSQGVTALDQINGPTLTIEGLDENQQPQTWYVRLWNYATGSPTDALIELPFSSLGSGWVLPGDAVSPTHIERMFISIVPPNFAADSQELLANRLNGHVIVSELKCEGKHAMLEMGDVRMPVHEERMATAYDDAYNQTPARLIRNIIGLGYRHDIVHYVGMSHFMRLEPNSLGELLVEEQGVICQPAENWHRSFFGVCRENNLEVITSISYELFDAYCHESWKQRTANGDEALTGWVPPSTLLSPANAAAMAWLQSCAASFVNFLEFEQCPVRFQIGEPWWWVTANGEICIYDEAAKADFGGEPPLIADLRSPLDSDQLDLLDRAGTLLAQSTAAFSQAVRSASSNTAEILLLAFTPTILNYEMPELHRANLPSGWARPAFDRLQLEDYDWLTASADALRRSAYQLVDSQLGYPISEQDYLAGFVLNPDDADTLWRNIDAGLDEAKARGVSRRYVWALPQVTRDGFTRIHQSEEDDMQAFDDILYPFALGQDSAVSAEFSTSVVVTASGHERRNSLWSDARVSFDVGPGIRSEAELSQLIEFFRARRGAARGFRIQDPFDHSSNVMTETPTMTDQLLGLGDGLAADFQLLKTYGPADDPQTRPITRPREGTILVSIDGGTTSNWSLMEAGVIQFETAPPQGSQVRAGFLFDVPVRFAEDRIDISGVNFEAGEAPSVPLVEVREAR